MMLSKGPVSCRKPIAGLPVVAYKMVSCLQTPRGVKAPYQSPVQLLPCPLITAAVSWPCVLSPGQAPPDLVAQLNKTHPFFRATQGKRTPGDGTSIRQKVICACSGRKGTMDTRSPVPRGQRASPAGRSTRGFITASSAHSCATQLATRGCPRAEPDVLQAEEMRQGRCWQPRRRGSPILFFHSLETEEEISVGLHLGM